MNNYDLVASDVFVCFSLFYQNRLFPCIHLFGNLWTAFSHMLHLFGIPCLVHVSLHPTCILFQEESHFLHPIICLHLKAYLLMYKPNICSTYSLYRWSWTAVDNFSFIDRFTDPKTKRVCNVSVAFQVRVRPNSYTMGPQTIGVNHSIDPYIENSKIEWFTKERSAIVPCALLIRVE